MGDSERLSTLEGQVTGIRHGQGELRNHIDDRIDALTEIVESGNRQKPISGPGWALIMLAISAVFTDLLGLIVLIDYYVL